MKKEKKEKIKNSLKASGLLTLIIIGITISSIYLFSVSDVIVEQTIGEEQVPERSWKPILTADADPGGDNSGFMYFMAKNHSANPTKEYDGNLTNGTTNSNCYEWTDSLNAEMSGETPYSPTAFDFIMKFRVNDTVGYNTSSSQWEITWVRANMTCDFDFATDVGADQEMTIIEIANNSNFAWYHAYLLDADGGAGTGFLITHNEKYNITSLTADGNY